MTRQKWNTRAFILAALLSGQCALLAEDGDDFSGGFSQGNPPGNEAVGSKRSLDQISAPSHILTPLQKVWQSVQDTPMSPELSNELQKEVAGDYAWFAHVLRMVMQENNPHIQQKFTSGFMLKYIHEAVSCDDFLVVKLFIEICQKHRKNINHYRDTHRNSLLHRAAQNGHAEIFQILLRTGGDVRAINGQRSSPLYLAAENGHVHILSLFLDMPENNHYHEDENAPVLLGIAAENGHTEVVSLLLGRGWDVNQSEGSNELTPLYIAAENGQRGVIGVLLQAGANMDQGNYQGEKPLHIAAGNGHLEVIEVLLEAGAHVNQVNDLGETALHYAAFQEHVDVIRYLCTHGADAHQETHRGEKPVDIATGNGRLRSIEALLDYTRPNQFYPVP